VRIAGVVEDELAPYIDEMTTVVLPVETVVRGTIVDRAALHGMLDHLQARGLELIEVRALPDEPVDDDRQTAGALRAAGS
jgi:hypothetical protein